MTQRPETLNGVPVPYGAPTQELILQANGAAPACWAAFVALAKDPSSQALQALIEGARGRDPHVRRAAVEAIASRPLNAEIAAVIIGALNDSDGSVVRTACRAAPALRTRDAHDRLIGLIASIDPHTREVALGALKVLWESDDFEVVFEVFRKDRSPRVQNEAASTLRARVTAGTWRPLFEAWRRDPLHRHRLWACEIGAKFGGADILEHLSVLAEDQDGHVRRAATKALSAIAAASQGAVFDETP
jgi:HEAT repeat protein